MSEIKMYGTNECPDCRRSKLFLEENGVGYDWVDIDQEPGAAELVVRVNDGQRSVPTIIFPDGSLLVEPTNKELAEKLGLSK